jgi:hypothetical protein
MVVEVAVAAAGPTVAPSRAGRPEYRSRRPSTRAALTILACFVYACTMDPRAAHAESPSSGHTGVLAAVGDSFKLLLIEHAMRISFQEKTRKSWAALTVP